MQNKSMIDLRKKLEENEHNLDKIWNIKGYTEEFVAPHIIGLMQVAIVEENRELQDLILVFIYTIKSEVVKVFVLNELLILEGHYLHQPITKEIQNIGHESSIKYIEKVLESDFSYLDYTCSEDEVIAKWFSWALYSIGTNEAIRVIKKYVESSNNEIASEMQYRLSKLNA